MTQTDKMEEASSSQAENPHFDSPPVYTPQKVPTGTLIHPPPATSDEEVIPERVHVPTAPFTTNLSHIGPEPTNVICPRCHYGVYTSTTSRAGTHAG
jgi:hypothetical protein